MGTDFENIFSIIRDSLAYEAERVKSLPSATPIHLLTGLRGLPVRTEAHIVHTIAKGLNKRGYPALIEEPYAISHSKGKVKRCDFKIALDKPADPIITKFLTFEVKHYLLLDRCFRGMRNDIAKIKTVLTDDHAILNIPVAFLLVGFAHEGREDWNTRRLESFVKQACIEDWQHFRTEFGIAPTGQPMRSCLLDMWLLSDL